MERSKIQEKQCVKQVIPCYVALHTGYPLNQRYFRQKHENKKYDAINPAPKSHSDNTKPKTQPQEIKLITKQKVLYPKSGGKY